MDKRNGSSIGTQNRLPDLQATTTNSLSLQKKDSDSQNTQVGSTVARKRRVHAQVISLLIHKISCFINGHVGPIYTLFFLFDLLYLFFIMFCWL